MTTMPAAAAQPLSFWWRVLAIVTMLFGFSVLIGLTVEAYRQAPPIPVKVVDPAGKTMFTREDVSAGRLVFLKYGLMANGTIWGHGAYLGPDFSAAYLHNWALEMADRMAQARLQRAYADLTPEQRAEIDGGVARTMKRVFGFLINMPIVSYFEIGTNLTANHSRASMMGVFGLLAVGLMIFVLRESTTDATWARLERYVRCGFWGLNIGLAMMVVLSLFPSGVLQMNDVIQNGYWHAHSLAYTSGTLPRLLEWLRLPGDLVFIVLGAAPLAVAMCLGYLALWTRRDLAVTPKPRFGGVNHDLVLHPKGRRPSSEQRYGAPLSIFRGEEP